MLWFQEVPDIFVFVSTLLVCRYGLSTIATRVEDRDGLLSEMLRRQRGRERRFGEGWKSKKMVMKLLEVVA